MSRISSVFAACLLAGSATLCAMPALAAPADAGAPAVQACWVRAMPGNLPSSAYFDVQNPARKALKLVGVDSPAFGMAMMHRSSSEGGVARMMMVDSVDIPAGGKLSFAPGGYHVMLEEAKQPLAVGATVPLTLQFDGHAPITASCVVRPAAARAAH
ncbi:copper chaperone PCu(A)C [Chitinasiproducens palmae]|uniref:Copper chaperone PCu(A)C n=1 Tax=Chitinasiproducens palmae TaxID=1770053 RepID=A0A1H2PVB8_9BURK|nr:copper chaperone PCu(A)C [Chitinasiproducens palmae]SDV51193.1 hypothetical protein SAMN05216551_115103 [Chitinasiproducens palmae]